MVASRAGPDTSVDAYDVASWERRTPLDTIAKALAVGIRRYRGIMALPLLIVIDYTLLRPYAPALITPVGILIVLASVIPAAVMVFVASRFDLTSKEPIALLARVFFFGALLAAFAGIMNDYLAWLPNFVRFTIIVGPGEELVKLAAVALIVFTDAEFDDAVDGLFYGIAAGAGFAAIESILYGVGSQAMGGFSAAATTVILRSAVSAPGHMLWAGIAGYYLGVAKFDRENRLTLVIKGLLIAFTLHVAYDITVNTLPPPWSIGVVLLLHAATIAWVVRKMRGYFRYHGLLPAA